LVAAAQQFQRRLRRKEVEKVIKTVAKRAKIYARVKSLKARELQAYVILLAAEIGSRRPSISTSSDSYQHPNVHHNQDDSSDELGPRKVTVSVDLEDPMVRIDSWVHYQYYNSVYWVGGGEKDVAEECRAEKGGSEAEDGDCAKTRTRGERDRGLLEVRTLVAEGLGAEESETRLMVRVIHISRVDRDWPAQDVLSKICSIEQRG
jgi:hypothetical protein